eukprot:GSA25T00003492001.1
MATIYDYKVEYCVATESEMTSLLEEQARTHNYYEAATEMGAGGMQQEKRWTQLPQLYHRVSTHGVVSGDGDSPPASPRAGGAAAGMKMKAHRSMTVSMLSADNELHYGDNGRGLNGGMASSGGTRGHRSKEILLRVSPVPESWIMHVKRDAETSRAEQVEADPDVEPESSKIVVRIAAESSGGVTDWSPISLPRNCLVDSRKSGAVDHWLADYNEKR